MNQKTFTWKMYVMDGGCFWNNSALLLHCHVEMCKNCVYVLKLCPVLMSTCPCDFE